MQHIPDERDLRNLLLTISYDGRQFHGWQIQQNAYTVQEAFQTALTKIIGEGFDLKGCSRTDTGVHANMYCISLKTTHPIPPERLKAALNRWLPLSVAWNSEVRSPFLEGYALHYRYPLDEKLLNDAAQAYVGKHDFTSFCTLDNREQGDLARTVKAFSVTREGDMVIMKVEADGFLYNMVRIMVGTLLRVAQGKFRPNQIPEIIESRSRSCAGPTAQACGLYLNKVNY